MKLKFLLGTLLCSSISLAQVPSYVPTNGLVGWWPFNGNANDESTNTNNGTVNGATLTTDRNSVPNSAYNFNGTSDFIEVPHDASLTFGNNQISISMWIEVASFSINNPSFNKIALSKQSGDGTSQVGFNVWYTAGGHGLRVRNGSGGNFGGVGNNQPISLSTWTHVVYIWDGSNGYYYENGELLNSGNSTNAAIGANTVPLLFGKPNWSNVNAEPFSGKLDDIAIYNRPLTACEVQDLYSASFNSLSGVSQSGSLLTSDISSAQYQWLDCADNYSVINGETNQSYTPANTGSYSVEITLNGCVDTSACYLVDFTGISEVEENFLLIYPNPVSDVLSLKSKYSGEITITNIIGEVVLVEDKQLEQININVSSLPSGTYFVKQGNSIFKLIKE